MLGEMYIYIYIHDSYMMWKILTSFPLCLLTLQPRIDDKYRIWLHLNIRPSSFPLSGSNKYEAAHGKLKTKQVRDGRWTLAFSDEEICKNALSMIFEERSLQSNEVERRLRTLLDLDSGCNLLQESTSSRTL